MPDLCGREQDCSGGLHDWEGVPGGFGRRNWVGSASGPSA